MKKIENKIYASNSSSSSLGNALGERWAKWARLGVSPAIGVPSTAGVPFNVEANEPFVFGVAMLPFIR